MTERIDHAAEAVKHIEWAHNQQAEQGEFDFTVRDNALIAHVHATLALVDQQCIANLVALGEVWVPGSRREPWDFDGPDGDLKPEIKEGLGL